MSELTIELREKVRQLIKSGVTPLDAADEIRLNHPGLYQQFLAEQGPRMFRTWAAHYHRMMRSTVRRSNHRKEFIGRIANGDGTALRISDMFIDVGSAMIQVGEMEKDDWKMSSELLQTQSDELQAQARIHRRFYELVPPGKKTRQVLTEEQIEAIFKEEQL